MQGQNPFGGGGFTPPATQNPMAAPNSAFVISIDADPTWEPLDTFDLLEVDGLFAVKVTKESVQNGDGGKTRGVFMTLQIQDNDLKGKVVSKFMTDPASAKNDVRFTWRLLIMSLGHNKDVARAAFNYQPGMLTGKMLYCRTKRGQNRDGKQITNVENFVTREDYELALKENRHRWKAEVAIAPTSLPSGVPPVGGAFAGLGAFGAPGAPTGAPAGGPMMGSPTPTAATPFAAPVAAAPVTAPAGGFAAVPPPAMVVSPAQAMVPQNGFPPGAPAQAFSQPPVAPTTSPVPGAASPFPSFPGASS